MKYLILMQKLNSDLRATVICAQQGSACNSDLCATVICVQQWSVCNSDLRVPLFTIYADPIFLFL